MATYAEPRSRHDAVGAWFLGPRAENFPQLAEFVTMVLDKQKEAEMSQLDCELDVITEMLNNHSVPFWSTRYNAHMSMEASLPSIIGYLTGILHNQNNVATEGGPFTTILEQIVGRQLCHMLGYSIFDKDIVKGWGHITCGGTVANLESIWAARNLKFYPLSLFLAITEGTDLQFLRARSGTQFEIELCTGAPKPFTDCSSWELLNLKPSTILEIPDRLYNEYGVSSTALAAALKKYSIQETGKDYLEKRFGIESPIRYFVGTTKHYSWPKGAAITGIGANQMVDVPLDLEARMDTVELEKMLNEPLNNKQALYAVVAIIGSTEQGAVDPLVEILKLRNEFQKKGLSFVVHCDAAWGGYFASLIPKEEPKPGWLDPSKDSSFVPRLALPEYTEKQLKAFKDADSITIDPHKMRYLVTWTAPVIFWEGDDLNKNIGVFGVEGSKPGAAAVGAYLSHRVVGLNRLGYATLLGETIFTSARLYCHWAAMEETKPIDIGGTKIRLIVRPFTMLPSERKNETEDLVEAERQFIRDEILGKDNEELMKNEKAVEILKKIGGDLMINAFACNFEINGKVNEDVVEANYFNSRIFQLLSITDPDQDIKNIPLFLTSTSLKQSSYTKCLTRYKDRLGLKGDQDLSVLINVTMSPWPSSGNFIEILADKFRRAAEGLMESVKLRNVEFPHLHGFVIQGLDNICGVHLPMFNMENHRYQLIISCDFPPEVLKKYRDRKKAKPRNFFTFGNIKHAKLQDLIQDGASFQATLDEGLPENETGNTNRIEKEFTVSNVKILLKRSLHSKDLKTEYPEKMVFYGYGSGGELDMDHLLSTSPNMQLNSERIKIVSAGDDDSSRDQIQQLLDDKGAWLRLTSLNERVMQPLLMAKEDKPEDFKLPGLLRFKPGEKFTFEAYPSPEDALASGTENRIARGELELGPSVFGDTRMLNMDGGIPEPDGAGGDGSGGGGGGGHKHKHASTTAPPARLPPPLPGAHADTAAALAAEYPQPAAGREYQVILQTRAIRRFKVLWKEYKVKKAREVEEEHRKKGTEPPVWLKTWMEQEEYIDAIPDLEDGPPVLPLTYHHQAAI